MASSNSARLQTLECLCVKSITPSGGSVDSTGGVVKARLTCTPAALRANLIASAAIEPPVTSVRMVGFPETYTTSIVANPVVSSDFIAFEQISSSDGTYTGVLKLDETLVIPVPSDLRVGSNAEITVEQFTSNGSTFYINETQKEQAVDLETVAVTFNYLVTNITGNIITLKYVSSTNNLDVPIEDMCSEFDAITGWVKSSRCFPLVKFTTKTKRSNPFISSNSVLSANSSVNNLFSNETFPIVASGKIETGLTVSYDVNQHAQFNSTLDPTYIDKFAGDFGDFECVQKLFPSGDLPTDPTMDKFVGPLNQSGNLYTFIDEGIFTGDYDKPFGQSTLVSDDQVSFIHPNTIHTEGTAQYKCELTNFRVRPENTRFRIRASAPIQNYESKVPPKYTINEIKFKDPSGNLIVHYDDIHIKGDAIYKDVTHVNFATYSTKPKINNTVDSYDWQNQLFMHQISGYTLSFNVRSEALDDAFNEGFDQGFEENYIISHVTHASGDDYLALDGSPLSTQDQSLINPTRGVRISAVEICNSGGYGPRPENYINLHAESETYGRRLERKILPSFMPLYDFDTGIYPSVSSIWYHNNNELVSNLNSCGSEKIIEALREDNSTRYTTLNSVGPHLDSGKLTLKFSHEPTEMNEIIKGAFHCGFDQSICSVWTDPSGAFDTQQNKNSLSYDDGFFVAESVTLKVKAKKSVGSRDYVLDVVGYSDDKLLNVTSAVGGFLQNPSGVGIYPSGSGFAGIDDLGISSESISEKDDYFMQGANNAGGDHYSLVQSGHSYFPIVTGTDFQDYEIPLKIYDDTVKIGKSRDYRMSSLFENLYLDIYPLPSGATIASAYLLVRYAPQNALMLSVDGGENIRKIQDGRGEGKISPTFRQPNDNILNAGSGYNPLSTIENIPHAYTTPSTIKSNYSRRWRGMEGTVQGPFSVDNFGFGFENPPVDFPFLSGYYDFDNVDGLYIKSRNLDHAAYTDSAYDNFGQVSGLCTQQPEIYKNIGWRFSTGTLFENALPGWSGAYKTSDWTSLSSGTSNFQSHELYGHIADAFNNIVRISGQEKSINFGNIDTASGFSIFTRFTPDANMSGVNYNLFESGILYAKWDNASELDFALGYSGGYLCGYSKDKDGNIITVADTIKYSGYQFPLNTILTYNDHQSSGLKLYTDNETYKGSFTTLRATSEPFYKNNTNADLVLGYGAGSGVGMNMLVSEFGISTYLSGVKGSGTNIVESNPNRVYKQVTAQKFLENSRVKFFDPDESHENDSYKLWDYVNEDTFTDWDIGAFQHCPFSLAFNQVNKRPFTRDLIGFNIESDGLAYITNNDLALPTNVNSGVAYHTQLENDFLRFHLSDTSENFYSTHKRITKSLPRGYKFKDRSLVVETVIEHTTDSDIVWPDCNETVGPKLIVSLYPAKQEPYWTPDAPNWGLINRDIHYLKPSSCLMRLDSKFTYDSLIDSSESWALFPNEPRLKDFEERYFSQDVDDMFLQYDLVYPSGPAFESRINIHTAHVRLDDAYVTSRSDSGIMNLMSSGGNVVNNTLNLNAWGPGQSSGSLNLIASGHGPTFGNLNFNISGEYRPSNTLNINLLSYLTNASGVNLSVSGELGTPGGSIFNMVVDSLGVHNVSMPMSLLNSDTSNVPDSTYLPLFTWQTTDSGIRDFLPAYIQNSHENDPTNSSGNLSLMAIGSNALVTRYPFVDMPLFINVDHPLILEENVNLTLYHNETFTGGSSNSGQMKLFTANYGGVGSDYFRWFNSNFGDNIDLQDNAYASLTADNEIRGVDLIGCGTCDGTSTSKAVDPALVTDETEWRPETCNEGGIFRGVNTYTNLTASGFGTTTGFSGNYYGIRKYGNLIPNAPYLSTLKVSTGSTEAIKVPRTFEDWEYGTCGPSFGANACCTADCDQDLAYSGVKLIGDYPHLSGDATITPPSGRNTGDNYGKSVAVREDLMAVGSPLISVPDGSGYELPKAGTVYLYRRGEDVAGQKASWQMQDKLMLPSGYRRDYVTPTNNVVVSYGDFSINANKWNIGQEGREFGSSVDIGASGDRETVVVGAPKAAFTRQFSEIETSGIPVCMIAFVDNLSNKNYDPRDIFSIARTARKYDILYKYFSAPWNAKTDDEFQPRIDIKLLVFDVADPTDEQAPIVHGQDDWFHHRYLDRIDKATDKSLAYTQMFNAISGSFLEMFPSGVEKTTGRPHSGIPPIVGIFQDSSPSLRRAFKYNGIDVVDEFIDFYGDYSYSSGVVNPEVPVAKSGSVYRIFDESQKWNQSTIELINKTLDSGRLLTTQMIGGVADHKVMSFITSGVGQKWAQEGAYDFQIPPSSGGRVYVFEKESGVFNCVQEIKSFDDRQSLIESQTAGVPALGYGTQYHDRYGHAVSISANSEVISIGSPYTTTPCEVYERKDSENQRMYSKIRDWLVFVGLTDAVTRYDELLSASGASVAQSVTYHELSHSNKFKLRIDESFWGTNNAIQLYKPVYNYSYNDIQRTGTWDFIIQEYLGTSRLGYSTSVSDDGDTVAFGAPTDSMNEFEDTNIWYKGYNTWGSYTNAGAVRIFESKKYYPHSGVVEFAKFGNLDRSYHKEEREAGYYDQMGLYFGPDSRPFARTEFSDLEIPTDAGLAFIITPEIDAASDEVIDNIKNWLSLGDRTLVLVGNDPVYEENGLYLESNQILNKILKKLGSRMRIHEANSKEASLPECVSAEDVANNRYNITKASVPEYAYTTTNPSTIVRDQNLYAKGVGQILMDLSDLDLEDTVQFTPCDELNGVCSHPIKHNGDLRAQWNAECEKIVGDRVINVPYKVNWPFHFGNSNPSSTCDDPPKGLINRPNQDIVPILTTAEFLPERTEKVDAYTTKVKNITSVYENTVIVGESSAFEDSQEDQIKFSVSGDINSQIVGDNLLSLKPAPLSTHEDGSAKFFDPVKVNTRDGILQAKGEAYTGRTVWKKVRLSDESILALQEKYKYTVDNKEIESNSNVVIIASTMGENSRSLGNDLSSYDPNNKDQNVLFYVNTIKSSCNDDSKLVQLGGWTGRTSFTDAYTDSDIKSTITSFTTEFGTEDKVHINIEENAVYSPGDTIDVDVDTIWIANPLGTPTDSDVAILKNWLKSRDAKDANGNYVYPQTQVVITYSATNDNAQEIAENVAIICEKLGLKSRPFPASMNPHDAKEISEVDDLRNKGKYFVQRFQGKEYRVGQEVNTNTQSIAGCPDGYKFMDENISTQVESLAIIAGDSDTYTSNYIPMSGGKNVDGSDAFTKIISYQESIDEHVPYTPDRYQINAETNIKFAVQPGSGYRMFVNWVSEGPDEEFALDAEISKVNRNPIPVIEVDGSIQPKNDTYADQNSTTYLGKNYVLEKTTTHTPNLVKVDFQAPTDATEITVRVHTDKWSKDKGAGIPNQSVVPYTPRILSVSGCLLPIQTVETNTPARRWVRDDVTETEVLHPASENIIPEEFRPVKHVHKQYCSVDDDCSEDSDCYGRCQDKVTEIEDGPVVAAEEYENFSSAVNGYERSKIVVLTDSTMIQGQCPQYRGAALANNQAFIRSLYPTSPDARTQNQLGFSFSSENLDGRQFNFVQKLRAPERGSPAKYYAASGLAGINRMFGKTGTYGSLNNYVDNEDLYHPADVTRESDPIFKSPEEKEAKIKEFMTSSPYNVYPRFSGDFLGVGSYTIDGQTRDFITDAGLGGGIPELMKLTGKDYLDFDIANSGCPGDLFGYSVDLSQNKLVVGTPFNAFHFEESISGVSGLVPWASISGDNNPDRSGIRVSANGGAGAAFYFERTGSGSNVVSEVLPWQFKQKIKPSSVNVGFDCEPSDCVTSLQAKRGNHNLDSSFILENAQRTDQFGHSVAIDADMMVIGAPNHDFETIHHHIYSGTSAFQRKSFNAEFTIPAHSYYDLGSSGVRIDKFSSNSGAMVLNNGAVFNYRYEMVDWPTRTQEWKYAEKLYPHGYNDRVQGNDDSSPVVSGCENDFFGTSVSINRANRGDSDYTLVVGSPEHDFVTSGNHVSSGLLSAGAAYSYDAMLREQIPSIPNSQSFIGVEVFGDKSNAADVLSTTVYQNTTGDPQIYTSTGIVFSNSDGNIFVEASGYDPSTKGFISHRPYIESVIGSLLFGTPSSGTMPLVTSGMPVTVETSGISLYMTGPDSANVYNNIGLYTDACIELSSGTIPLSILVPSGTISSGMNLMINSNTLTNNLNLRVRGV